MDSNKAFKYVSVIALSFLLVGNGALFFANNGDEKEATISEAQSDELHDLREENERLRYLEEYESPTAREQLFQEVEKQSKRFISSIFEQNADTYQEQKAEAENVMNEDLMDRFFAADMYGEQQVETSIDEAHYYFENLEKNRGEVDVVMDVTHTIHYVQTNQEDQSRAFIRVTFEREHDQWIATDIQDVS
ncbi:hypothetical protein [Thalassobacillus sp. C254]|uniref:hypothetical protein n=1 Tax=Thalassobacillus sp. C254 TaxID=1225341 RepID=UPI0006D16080|nr:hypothetical protein [Thalassobacillus sp. C254]